MPNLNSVDRAHQDLHQANDALEAAMAEEAAAQQAVAELQAQLAAAETDLAQKTAVREQLTAEYNTGCDDLSAESLNAKVGTSPSARFRT